ncbi:MAG: endonuclease MutS2 [Clostridia bacterium]|nr:endonuclease MutS2 [Clostridia bacterium]
MMNITQKTINTLEFDKIRGMLAALAPTAGAAELARELLPSDRIATVRASLGRTTDARRLADAKGAPSFGSVSDISAALERADKGAVLTPRELLDVGAVLRTSRGLLEYIRSNRTFDTTLDEIFERLIPDKKLEERISRSIISEDMIADEASSELSDIRRKIRVSNIRIKDTLKSYVSGSYSKYLQENIVTMRNGRYVVPVKAECRGEIKGLIHDTSSSGATVFVEPMSVVEANNELRMLEAKEAHEIERVLADMSAQVSGISSVLRLNYENITELAFVFACAELSRKMKASEPVISEGREITLKKARHPLIDPAVVVPINVSLGADKDTLIITGPNTGGKTVTLKTLGLFTLMAQAGLHIPAEDGSSVAIREKVLVDLGDEQSIEQSLSTFSSHMVNIISIINEKNSRSLVLFDELGAGTDPVEGAALAVAVIENIRAAGALCAATTHYAELKAYALDTDGVVNASCEFDVETLRPTYKLIVGAPGRSNAFAISRKLGMPDAIIERANEYVSTENKRFEAVIGELEAERCEMEREKEKARALREEYEKYKAEADAEIARKLENAEKTLERAREKSASMVQSAKLSSDFIMEQMERVRRERDSERLGEELERARRELREHLRSNERKFDPVVERKRDEKYVLPRELRRGDEVLIVSLGRKATVLADPDRSGKVEVQAGIIKTKVSLADLELIEEVKKDSTDKKRGGYKMTVNRDFRDEIDLRGKTGDEAWSAVDKYIDEATMAGFSTIRLIHGKGTGALKSALWEYLRRDSRVAKFRIGKFGEGDGGVTVVELK